LDSSLCTRGQSGRGRILASKFSIPQEPTAPRPPGYGLGKCRFPFLRRAGDNLGAWIKSRISPPGCCWSKKIIMPETLSNQWENEFPLWWFQVGIAVAKAA
jgi:hypothetical protein